jgi:F-type H+-transporting ATPase subunit b
MNTIWIIAEAGTNGAEKAVEHLIDDAAEAVESTGSHAAEAGHHAKGPMDPDSPMFFWTLGIFICLLVVLSKVAWKQIVTGLAEREDTIRKSLEDAEAATKRLEDVQEESKRLIAEADVQAKAIMATARNTAKELAKDIEDKAKSDAQAIRDNVLKEIESAKKEATLALRRESAELAISLASKLLGENLDTEKNRSLTEQLINKI